MQPAARITVGRTIVGRISAAHPTLHAVGPQIHLFGFRGGFTSDGGLPDLIRPTTLKSIYLVFVEDSRRMRCAYPTYKTFPNFSSCILHPASCIFIFASRHTCPAHLYPFSFILYPFLSFIRFYPSSLPSNFSSCILHPVSCIFPFPLLTCKLSNQSRSAPS